MCHMNWEETVKQVDVFATIPQFLIGKATSEENHIQYVRARIK